jgi:hypothetical protein
MLLEPLTAVSSVDGRYRATAAALAEYFSLQIIAAELAARGPLAPSGQPYHASSIRHMLVGLSELASAGGENFAEHMSATYGAGMTVEKGDVCGLGSHRRGRALDRHSQDIRFYIAEVKSAQKCATADGVDMRYCTFPNTSRML